MKRNIQGKWEYCAFVEGQPERDDMPHFHIISTRKCPKRIKDVAVWNGFGHQAKQKRVNSGGAAFYVAKYASKQASNTPRGFRRVRTSSGWTPLPTRDSCTIYVQAAKEGLQDYLARVASETMVPLDTIVTTWLSKETAFDYWEREVQS